MLCDQQTRRSPHSDISNQAIKGTLPQQGQGVNRASCGCDFIGSCAEASLKHVTHGRLIINDENAALTRYLAGELDMTDIPAGQYPRLHEEYPDQAISFPNSCSYYYVYNLAEGGPEALQDLRVRQALSLAVDRDVIVENVLAGGQRPAYTFTHWAISGWEVPDMAVANMTQPEGGDMDMDMDMDMEGEEDEEDTTPEGPGLDTLVSSAGRMSMTAGVLALAVVALV